MRTKITFGEVEKAARLIHEEQLTWKETGERLSRDPESIRRAYHRFRDKLKETGQIRLLDPSMMPTDKDLPKPPGAMKGRGQRRAWARKDPLEIEDFVRRNAVSQETLPKDELLKIAEERSKGRTWRETAEDYGITGAALRYRYKRARRWHPELPDPAEFPRGRQMPHKTLKPRTMRSVKRLRKAKESWKKIAKRLGMNPQELQKLFENADKNQ